MRLHSGWFGHLLSLTNHHAEAVAEADRALEIDSDSAPPVLFMAVQANMVAGDTAKAKIIAERLWARVPQWRGAAAFLLAELGDRARATAVARQIEAKPEPGYGELLPQPPSFMPCSETRRKRSTCSNKRPMRGDLADSRTRSASAKSIRCATSARFAAIVRRVGLDERIFTSPTGGRPQ